MDTIDRFIKQMPKAELHVHLEGSVWPRTLLRLAKRHHIPLPADDIEGLRRWYTFRDFDHFLAIYLTIASCLRTPADIELITREFLLGQAEQNIVYSEVTFTPYNQFLANQFGFHEQIDAVNRAREWGERELNVRMGMIIDIPRHISPQDGLLIANWTTERYGDGVIAFGLGGQEVGNPPSKFQKAFDLVQKANIPCILHAGETAGPTSIWGAIHTANSQRIGHGVRAIEDPALMDYLRRKQLPLEVCPSSNICLRVFPSLAKHSLPRLFEAGLYVTINSDDPPMFNTTLTEEYLRVQISYGWGQPLIEQLVLNAVDATLLPGPDRQEMRHRFETEFEQLQPGNQPK